MKKLLVPCALAVALVIPAEAVAKTKQYAGPVTPSGTVSITTKTTKKKGKKKRTFLTRFAFNGVPVNCDDGPHTTLGFYTPSPPDRFRGSLNLSLRSSSGSGTSFLEVHGTLAGGTISVAGDNVPLEGGGFGNGCSTGVLNWTAARV